VQEAKEHQKRLRAEAALREKEALFRSFLEHSQAVIWITKAQNYELVYVSPAYEQVWGRSTSELYSDLISFLETIHPEDRDRVRTGWQECHQRTCNQEYRVLRPDGTIIWIQDCGFPIYDDQGKLLWLGGIAEDITERKRTEATMAADLRDMRLLRDLSIQTIGKDNPQVLYNEIMSSAIALTGADAGTLQILDRKTQELVLLASQGFDSTMKEHFSRVDTNSNTSCGMALRNGERTFVDFDVSQREDPDSSLQRYIEAGYLSAQSTPTV
jgi:PAS domain S-box-containing protein